MTASENFVSDVSEAGGIVALPAVVVGIHEMVVKVLVRIYKNIYFEGEVEIILEFDLEVIIL